MADQKSMRECADSLCDLVLELQTFADLCVSLAGDCEGAPEWPWLVSRFAERIGEGAQSLAHELRGA